MLSVREARERILARISRLDKEEISLDQAHGRVLAEEVRAARDVPPFDNSAMDGYAVRAEDIRTAAPDHPVRLRLIGEVRAGFPAPASVEPKTALRVMTGAIIPAGSDTVVRLEDTAEADNQVEIRVTLPRGTSLRAAGSDIRKGDLVGRDGQLISPGLLGVLASVGRTTLQCTRKPRVMILTTGDELRDAGEPLAPGQITNTNRYTLAAAVEEAGGIAVDAGTAKDDRAELIERLSAARDADLVISSGGVSMGAYDLVRSLLEERNAIDFWQVALRPGKPLAFGSVGKVPLISLPGNPVSSLVAFELFGRPAILKLLGRHDLERPRLQAVTEEALSSPPHLEQYFRGIARWSPRGLRVRLTGDQGSHVLRSMAEANCLVIVPQDVGEIPAGGAVEILPIAPIE